MRVVALLLIATLASLGYCQDHKAHLLVAKHIHNKFLVENQDIVVEYNIYNIGDSAAHDIRLNDAGFNAKFFELVKGLVNFKVDRLSPGANVSHSVVVRPKQPGYYNFTAAEIQYRPTEDSQQIQLAFSSEPGEGGVASYRDFDRKFSPHLLDWAAFVLMTLPSLGVPFFLWFKSKSKYENIAKRIKKH